MITEPQQRLADVVAAWRNFEECIVHELTIDRGLFVANLKINVIWGPDGRLRTRVLEDPRIFRFELVGLEAMRFAGSLTDAMRQHPQDFGWGIGEVAAIRPTERGLGLRLLWESERSLELLAVSIRTYEPPAEPA